MSISSHYSVGIYSLEITAIMSTIITIILLTKMIIFFHYLKMFLQIWKKQCRGL